MYVRTCVCVHINCGVCVYVCVCVCCGRDPPLLLLSSSSCWTISSASHSCCRSFSSRSCLCWESSADVAPSPLSSSLTWCVCVVCVCVCVVCVCGVCACVVCVCARVCVRVPYTCTYNMGKPLSVMCKLNRRSHHTTVSCVRKSRIQTHRPLLHPVFA